MLPSSSTSVPEANETTEKWMAFPSSGSQAQQTSNEIREELNNAGISQALVERAAEWGLVVRSESGSDHTNNVKVGVRPSKERGGGESTRTSGESSHAVEPSVPRVSQELKDALSTLQQTFVVSDATRPDCPVMYASAGFFSMTGYSTKEVIGRNCRFLQGPDTDETELAKIREAVRTGKSYCGRLLNYKKNGTPFWNLLTLTPVRDDSGNVIKFIGMQVEVSKYTDGKSLRPNALPLSLIRYDARQKEKALSSMTEVVQTMQHPRTHPQGEDRDVAEKPEEMEKFPVESPLLNSADPKYSKSPGRQPPLIDIKRNSSSMSSRKSRRYSLMGFRGRKQSSVENNDITIEPEILMTRDVQRTESWEHTGREKDIRQGIDLATTLERIEKNFVITDPRLPDNPIIYASDSFLELTEYSREEILGRNCRYGWKIPHHIQTCLDC